MTKFTWCTRCFCYVVFCSKYNVFFSCRYRIVAIDHDIVSFVDTIYGNLPVILITNPKDARFLVPQREPYWRIKRSTHIR